MNETIKSNAGSSWSPFIVKFFIGSVLLSLMVYAKFYLHMRFYDIWVALFKILSIDLWFVGYNTLQQALTEVNREPIPIVKIGTYLSMFISFLFLFAVNPILFLISRKKLNNYRLEQKEPLAIVRIGYFISFAILIAIPANTIASAIALNSHFEYFKKISAELKYQRVDVKSELWKIVFKAQQYYILPVEEGGGGKSFTKNGKPVSLNDLGFEERTSLGRFILYQQKSDTTLYLYFFGNRVSSRFSYSDPNIVNVVENKVTIYPSDFKLE
ncbi:MAG: hypothetical protein HYV29_08975 [Ignavibacteriales bacterium]|nr:hypothetical protein [Ignavibacteriales bacterium]